MMEPPRAPSPISFARLLKLSLFETIHARRRKCPDPSESGETEKKECGECGGSWPPQPSPRCPAPASEGAGAACGSGDAPEKGRPSATTGSCRRNRCDLGDLGKVGAGVTGSRSVGKKKQSALGLPGGARFPGLLRHLHGTARRVIPQCFEGGVLNVRQRLGDNWSLGHALSFCQVSPGGYRLLAAYSGDAGDVGMPYCLLEAAPGGQMCCEGRAAPTRATRATLVSQLSKGELLTWESTLDAYFRQSTASVITVNRELIALHYLQGITKRVALGAEVVMQGCEQSSASAAVKWAVAGDVASASLGTRGMDLCYAHKHNDRLTLAALLEVGFASRRALATLAYEYRGGPFTVRASADTDGLVGGLLCRDLGGGDRFSLSCALSGLYNHANDKFRLGFGATAVLL